MVARATIEHCRAIGDEVIAKTRQELDISDKQAVFDLFEREKFDAALNCAAYTNVDGAETNKEICRAANSFGVENLALASKKINSAFVTISTDYVFDGGKNDFYTQRDTPSPLGVYGRAKLEGEILARNAYARSIMVRSGWIFGAGGTNFLSVMHKLLGEGKKIKAIEDAYGTPTFAVDLARRMRDLVEIDLPCVYHVTNSGKGASYADFARKVCEFRGYDTQLLESALAHSLKRPAPRPKSSKLACLFSEKFGLSPIRSWEQGLEDFLSKG